MAQAVQAPPLAPVDPVIEILHGIEITDPYRWLEDQNSARTRKWLEEQAAYTHAYLDAIPVWAQIRERVKDLLALKETISEPWNVGERYFFMKRRNKSEQPVIIMKNGSSGPEKVLVDPAKRGTGDSTAIGIVAISDDGRLLAYSVRQGGTDHSALEILDIENDCVIPDSLPEGFCTGFVFAPDGSGFYYCHRELCDLNPHYRAAFWHHFGAGRSQDQEVFFAGNQPNLFLGILHSAEARLLGYVVFSAGKAQRTSVYVQDDRPQRCTPKLLLRDLEGCFVPFFVRGQLLAYTDFAAPNFRIVHIDVCNPDPSQWHDVVPESDRRIQQFAVAADQVFVTRVDRFSTKVEIFGIDRVRREAVPFFPPSTIDFLNQTTSSGKLFYSRTSISEPVAIYCYDPRERRVWVCDEPGDQFALPTIAVEETEFISKDGTTVPILIAGREDLLHSGALPTFLTGYGGFATCVTPRFTAFATFLIEQGFLFAVPALRGGSELGEQWHLAGKRGHRQNAFDDFIAAAEWLIEQKHSSAGRIAIGGGSNAGLLVGATITQRPELVRAAICLGPLFDMIRYHLFDFAGGWVDEYGSPNEEQDFRTLLDYSPYHNVQDGVNYPSVLIVSGDSDTRCNPMHARKMTARLQAATIFDRLILLDYKANWGHTPVQPLSTKIDALTSRLAFVCRELGIPIQQRNTK